jgi:hypothetical protein
MRRNIDLIAITVLLAGAELYSVSRDIALSQPYRGVAVAQVIQRAMRCPKAAARGSRTVTIQRSIVVPGIPAIARVTVSSD